MGEFRIGRKFASHSYPEPRRDTTVAFARNFAKGPATSTIIAAGNLVQPFTGGTLVPWDFIESGAPLGTSVPITPVTTGIMLVSGVVCVKSTSTADAFVFVQVLLDGDLVPVPFEAVATIPPDGTVVIPILTEEIEAPGPTFNWSIRLVAFNSDGVLSLFMESSTLNIEERPAATG